MKKFFLLAVFTLMCMGSYAQLVTSNRVTVEKKKASALWLDFGIGAFSGDVADTGLGVDLGLRWNKSFTENIGWDIIKVKAQSDTKNFSELMTVQAMTGVRGTTPVLFGNSTVFGAAGLGYGYMTDVEEGGFCWEVSAGVNLTPRFLVGVAYNSQGVSVEGFTFHVNYVSLRLGVNF